MRVRRVLATTINNLAGEQEPAKPFQRLAMAVLLSAVRDLHSRNFASRLDAALWLVQDAPLYIDAVGMDTDTIQWLTKGATQNGIDEHDEN